LGSTEEERKPLKIKKFKFITTRAFTHSFDIEKEVRGNIVVAAILEGNSIALATIDGVELMRVTDAMDYAYGKGPHQNQTESE
jgi:hypothetical protein